MHLQGEGDLLRLRNIFFRIDERLLDHGGIDLAVWRVNGQLCPQIRQFDRNHSEGDVLFQAWRIDARSDLADTSAVLRDGPGLLVLAECVSVYLKTNHLALKALVVYAHKNIFAQVIGLLHTTVECAHVLCPGCAASLLACPECKTPLALPRKVEPNKLVSREVGSELTLRCIRAATCPHHALPFAKWLQHCLHECDVREVECVNATHGPWQKTWRATRRTSVRAAPPSVARVTRGCRGQISQHTFPCVRTRWSTVRRVQASTSGNTRHGT